MVYTGWIGPETNVDAVVKKNTSGPVENRTQEPQPIRHFLDFSIPADIYVNISLPFTSTSSMWSLTFGFPNTILQAFLLSIH
jgi:hypothetical protein